MLNETVIEAVSRDGSLSELPLWGPTPPHAFRRAASFDYADREAQRLAHSQVFIFLFCFHSLGSCHNACLKVILEKVHSPVGENKIQKWSKIVRTTGGGLKM